MIHTRVPWKWLDLVTKLEIPDDSGPLLKPYVVFVSGATWTWVIFPHMAQTQPRSAKQQARHLFYNTF